MARKALLEKTKRKPKYEVRRVNRCNVCGRRRAYMRKFGICRLCFRKLVWKTLPLLPNPYELLRVISMSDSLV